MMKLGSFTFVLHSHIPYVRKAGRWPHGEEMLHEVMAETYVPLLNALNDLKSEGVEPRLTIGLTPILLEQIADADAQNHFELYLEERLTLAEADIARHEAKQDVHLLYLARWYRDWYTNILASFRERYARDLIGAFKRLIDAGNLDVLTSAATHGYLPLFERDSTVYGQLKTGIESSRRFFGRAPSGIWLPECGYRPAYMIDNRTTSPTFKGDNRRAFKKGESAGSYKAGIEEFLADLNLGYFFTDTHVITGGKMVGKVAGDVAGPYGTLPARKFVVRADDRPEAKTRTTMRPYYVQAANVAVLGRDERTGMQVWSAAHGYPGDFVYREFHRKDPNSGLQYCRITAASTELGQKESYDPHAAFNQVHMHADHFVDLVTQLVRAYYYHTKKHGIIVSAYDTELFGHWWFEGIAWLKEVLRRLAKSADVELTTAGAYLDAHPPDEVLSLPESSWGKGGDHSTWLNPDTEWIWPLIHSAERTMETLVAEYPNARGDLGAVLNQAARELVLLESSDWPFLISTGQAKEYASGRFQQHLARFNHLAAIAQRDMLQDADRRFLANVADLDNPFANIDYRVFGARE
jgi:1,4-alpha-glucan branching enzyme